MRNKTKKIIMGTIVIVITTVGLVYFFNRDNVSLYKPNGNLEYYTAHLYDETNPYYNIGFSDYVFVGKVVKEKERYINNNDEPRTRYQITVTQNLKGNLQDDIEVVYPGGYEKDGTLILYKGDHIIDESLLDIDKTYIFVGIGQSNGDILLQTLYTDTPYSEEAKKEFMDYIDNSEEVTRSRSKSRYEK